SAPPLREAPLLVFSDDGSRLAILTADSISVREVAGLGLVLEDRPRQPLWLWGSRGFTAATFAGRDRLRVYCVRSPSPREARLEILELDMAGRRLACVGRAGPFPHAFPLLCDSRRERLLLRETSRDFALLDARSGATLRELRGGAAAYR